MFATSDTFLDLAEWIIGFYFYCGSSKTEPITVDDKSKNGAPFQLSQTFHPKNELWTQYYCQGNVSLQ